MNTNKQEWGSEVDAMRRVLIESADEPPEHVISEAAVAYVDGAVDGVDAEVIESHLDECRLCREDVDDLLELRRLLRRRRFRQWIAAAAVVPAAAAAWTWFAATRHQPGQAAVRAAIAHLDERRYENADWRELVSTALVSHRLPEAAIAATVRGPGGAFREPVTLTRAALDPAGVVIDSVYPHFRWPGTAKAMYRLTIVSGDDIVATIGPLAEAGWQCDRPLVRNRTYTWQVEVRAPGGSSRILPTTADPPAMFHIISEVEHKVIASAMQRHPHDHLLLAALFARSGMEAEAGDRMRRLAAERPTDVDVQRLVSNTLEQQ